MTVKITPPMRMPHMDKKEILELVNRYLGAWNKQVVEEVLDTYTDDVIYRDPNVLGVVTGRDNLRRHITRLFATWKMHWTLREAHPFEDGNGFSVLWRASFALKGGGRKVEIDGLDLVTVVDGLIDRNEVFFDRAALVQLM
jgi:ketosteroid isomerase-like protein